MSLSHSPSIVTNGLVFYYDANNTQKSWKGKPTTNLVNNPFLSGGAFQNNLYVNGYEGTATIVPAFTDAMRAISPYWTKFVTTAVTAGRCFFLNTGTHSTGVDYAFSCYIYTTDSNITSFNMGSDNGTISGTQSTFAAWATSDRGTVKRICDIYRSVAGGVIQGLHFTATSAVSSTFYYAAVQDELGSFPSPVVDGTRANTQSLLDLTNNNTITATSLTYASDNTFSFNGNSLTLPSTVLDDVSAGSICMWAKTTGAPAANGGQPWLNTTLYSKNNIYQGIQILSNYTIRAYYWNTDATPKTVDSSTVTSLNTWVYISYSWSTAGSNLYLNGELSNTSALTWSNNHTGHIGTYPYIGSTNNSGYFYTGQIPVVQIYNRALSADEVKRNFNAVRGRYGL